MHVWQNKDMPHGGLCLAGDDNTVKSPHAGWLLSTVIAEMSLQARVVVLSACQTALGVVKGEGVLGFGRALHKAGKSN